MTYCRTHVCLMIILYLFRLSREQQIPYMRQKLHNTVATVLRLLWQKQVVLRWLYGILKVRFSKMIFKIKLGERLLFLLKITGRYLEQNKRQYLFSVFVFLFALVFLFVCFVCFCFLLFILYFVCIDFVLCFVFVVLVFVNFSFYFCLCCYIILTVRNISIENYINISALFLFHITFCPFMFVGI